MSTSSITDRTADISFTFQENMHLVEGDKEDIKGTDISLEVATLSK